MKTAIVQNVALVRPHCYTFKITDLWSGIEILQILIYSKVDIHMYPGRSAWLSTRTNYNKNIFSFKLHCNKKDYSQQLGWPHSIHVQRFTFVQPRELGKYKIDKKVLNPY